MVFLSKNNAVSYTGIGEEKKHFSRINDTFVIMKENFRYFLVHKPYGVLSQFTRPLPQHRTLADVHDFPRDVYPVGRLDKDSEGLLILTNDKSLNHRLLNPEFAHRRTYAAQLDGQITEEALRQLRDGVTIKLGKSLYDTLPAETALLPEGIGLPERDPPVRYRMTVPTTWIELTLTEGKNRQVRRMCAKTGFPVLRLVRVSIENLRLDGLHSGEVREIQAKELYPLLRLQREE